MASTFRASLPLVGSSFVNKTGAIGLSLLPMILIEHQFTTSQSSFVMSVVKASMLAGTFLGGWFSDRIGLRKVLLAAFGLPAIGLAILPFVHQMWPIIFAACLAQVGNAFFGSSARLILAQMVESHQQQEAVAWLRTGNNMGHIVSYSLGALLAGLGTGILLLIDSATSLVAFGVAFVGVKPKPFHKQSGDVHNNIQAFSKKTLMLYAVFLFGFTFFYDIYIYGCSGKFKLIYGDEGLRIFSLMMVVNTVFCSLFAVPAARYFKSAFPNLSWGLVLVCIGAFVSLVHPEIKSLIFLGIFIATVGEIFVGAFSQYILLKLLPNQKQGTLYGSIITFQALSRVVSGALVFPVIINTQWGSLMFLIGAIPFVGVLFAIRSDLNRCT